MIVSGSADPSHSLYGIARDQAGDNIYVTDRGAFVIWKVPIKRSSAFEVFAGTYGKFVLNLSNR